jgi:hypothetical protein
MFKQVYFNILLLKLLVKQTMSDILTTARQSTDGCSFMATYQCHGAISFTLNLEAAVSCKTLIPVYQTTWYYIAEGNNL